MNPNYKYLNNSLMSDFAGRDVNLVTDLEIFDFKWNKNLMKMINDNSLKLIEDLKSQMIMKKPNKDFLKQL